MYDSPGTRATPPDSRSLHGKPPLGDEASRGFRGRYCHDTVVGKPVLSLSTRDINGAHPGLVKFNTRMERPPSYSSADTEELVHRARAAHEPRTDGEKLGMMMGLATGPQIS
ncbi:hypothetical protein QL285_092030 [Trifolium repens]|nr:hypothetical protein QL285_092030 [Trifolium repens]